MLSRREVIAATLGSLAALGLAPLAKLLPEATVAASAAPTIVSFAPSVAWNGATTDTVWTLTTTDTPPAHFYAGDVWYLPARVMDTTGTRLLLD